MLTVLSLLVLVLLIHISKPCKSYPLFIAKSNLVNTILASTLQKRPLSTQKYESTNSLCCLFHEHFLLSSVMCISAFVSVFPKGDCQKIEEAIMCYFLSFPPLIQYWAHVDHAITHTAPALRRSGWGDVCKQMQQDISWESLSALARALSNTWSVSSPTPSLTPCWVMHPCTCSP